MFDSCGIAAIDLMLEAATQDQARPEVAWAAPRVSKRLPRGGTDDLS